MAYHLFFLFHQILYYLLFTSDIIVEPGLFLTTSDANMYNNLSPDTKRLLLSTMPILSPSPSKAIPISAFEIATFF